MTQTPSPSQNQINPTPPEFELTENTGDPKIEKIIGEIAGELAYNYFSNSFGDKYNAEIARSEHIFKKENEVLPGCDFFQKRWEIEDREKDDRERVRNILIVGAGAPYDAYTAIPKGDGLIADVKNSTRPRSRRFLFWKLNSSRKSGRSSTTPGSRNSILKTTFIS